MSLKERYNFEYLENESERLVMEELEKQLDAAGKEKLCLCQDCVLDMAAYALNKIKPLYRVSLLGSLYLRSTDSGEYRNEVSQVVEEAVKKIADNPAH